MSIEVVLKNSMVSDGRAEIKSNLMHDRITIEYDDTHGASRNPDDQYHTEVDIDPDKITRIEYTREPAEHRPPGIGTFDADVLTVVKVYTANGAILDFSTPEDIDRVKRYFHSVGAI